MSNSEATNEFNLFKEYKKMYLNNKSSQTKQNLNILKIHRDSLLTHIRKGCGNKINYNGACMYISYSGKKRYCSTCTRRLKYLIEELK